MKYRRRNSEANFLIWKTFSEMPRLRNAEPYDSNDIVRWFAGRTNGNLEQAHKAFEKARDWSKHAEKPCLLFDRETREWRGCLTA